MPRAVLGEQPQRLFLDVGQELVGAQVLGQRVGEGGLRLEVGLSLRVLGGPRDVLFQTGHQALEPAGGRGRLAVLLEEGALPGLETALFVRTQVPGLGLGERAQLAPRGASRSRRSSWPRASSSATRVFAPLELRVGRRHRGVELRERGLRASAARPPAARARRAPSRGPSARSVSDAEQRLRDRRARAGRSPRTAQRLGGRAASAVRGPSPGPEAPTPARPALRLALGPAPPAGVRRPGPARASASFFSAFFTAASARSRSGAAPLGGHSDALLADRARLAGDELAAQLERGVAAMERLALGPGLLEGGQGFRVPPGLPGPGERPRPWRRGPRPARGRFFCSTRARARDARARAARSSELLRPAGAPRPGAWRRSGVEADGRPRPSRAPSAGWRGPCVDRRPRPACPRRVRTAVFACASRSRPHGRGLAPGGGRAAGPPGAPCGRRGQRPLRRPARACRVGACSCAARPGPPGWRPCSRWRAGCR